MNDKNRLVGEIVLKFNEIEFYLKHIIIKCLEPKKEQERFYSQILFNNSIINFSSKLKLFKNINSDKKWVEKKKLRDLINDIHYLNNIRNSLVHTENAIELEKDDNGEITNVYQIINFFKPSGELDILRLNEAYEIFNEKHKNTKSILLKIYEKL